MRQLTRGLGGTDPLALAAYARGIEASQSNIAEWPYMWLFPSAHSRHVISQQVGTIPTYTPGTPTSFQASPAYQVPDGMRFALRGFIIDGDNLQMWNQGSSDLTFTLSVISGGNRNVDYLTNLVSAFGSFTQGPFPIGGRLEFESLDVLQWGGTVTNNVTSGGLALFALWGHLYPTSEAA